MKKKSYLDGREYLTYFWPESPRGSQVWGDNSFLLSAYVMAAQSVGSQIGERCVCLDISTGPVLAPIIVLAPILDSIQLSDYCSSSREVFRKTPIDYWRGYVREILKLEGQEVTTASIEKRLREVADLVGKKDFVDVDITKEPMFTPDLDVSRFNLFTMHFVADSITRFRDDYDAMLVRVLNQIETGSVLLMSSLIESSEWFVGSRSYPSPKLTFEHILTLLGHNGLAPFYTCLQDKTAGSEVGHDGRMAVTAAFRK